MQQHQHPPMPKEKKRRNLLRTENNYLPVENYIVRNVRKHTIQTTGPEVI